MRVQITAGALALSGAVTALSDSSPWLLLSTAEFSDASNRNQIQTSSDVLRHTKDILATCPTDRYLVVAQPGVHTADLRRAHGCSMPNLCRAVEDTRIKGRYSVAEVVGDMENAGLAELIKSECAKRNKAVTVDEVSLAPLSSRGRASVLSENDAILGGSLDAVTKSYSYTILFHSSRVEPAYEPEFVDPLHIDLKRDLQGVPVRREENSTQRDTRPLFAKYQFFTPGIFMGIVVTVVLLSVLGVGLRALSSLEVSYGAFDKEMGPAAQKKQQ